MGIENIKEEKSKKKVVLSIIKIAVLITIVVGIPLYIYFFHRDWISGFKDYEQIVAFLERYEQESILIYIGIQALQVVISFLPGQVFQMAAGYLFSFWPALLFAMAGAVLGTAISFLLAKVLGRDFFHLFFGEEKMTYYIERLNSKKAYMIVFFIYLIPGIPKDMVSYAAGASEMDFKPFIILSAIGRLPGMVGCLLMGTLLDSKNYLGVGIIGCIAVAAFIICIIYRKKINKYLDKFYEKISRQEPNK